MRKRMPIFYSALLLTAVNLILRLGFTGFQVYLSGRIGPAGIGLLQLVLSVGGMAMTAGMAGIRTATMYLTAEQLGKNRPENVAWVLSGCISYSILFSGTVAAGLFVFAPKVAAGWIGDLQALQALRIYCCFLPINCLCGVMTGYFTAANRIGTLAAVEIGEQILSLITTLALLTCWAGHDLSRACTSVVLGSGTGAAFTLICLVLLRIKEKASTGPRISLRRSLPEAALPLALADDIKAGISTTENLMVPKRLSLYPGAADPMAAFGTVCGMVFPVLMFPAAIVFALAELLIPELARCDAAGSRTRIRYLTRRCLRVTMLYGFLCSGILFLSAKDLCLSLYKSAEAGTYLRLYALLAPMLYCDAITDAMTKGLGQQKACVRYNILTSLLDVIFLFFLLPRYGMGGYFVSFLVTHLLNFALSLGRLIKISQSRFSLHPVLVTGLCFGIALWLCGHIGFPALRGITFCLIFISLLFLTNVLRREDMLWIRGLTKNRASS